VGRRRRDRAGRGGLPNVVDAVDIPVVAAGGFFDGRGLAAALAYGAAGVAMGTRFLLTRESTVPDAVKQHYLAARLDGTVVTRKVDGLPHRVLRTDLVERLEGSGRLRGLAQAIANAGRFRSLTGLSWRVMVREGLAMRHGRDLTWAQVLMAANTPMLLRAGLVEGREDAGVLASGQVVGMLDDLPTCAELIDGVVSQAVLRLKSGYDTVVE
jgi:NAD(P)H-dependent flavin oxidoreductase YrpB (nitropropane dioxygenase family)